MNPIEAIHQAAQPIYTHREKWMSPENTRYLGEMTSESALHLLNRAIEIIRAEALSDGDDPDASDYMHFFTNTPE
jgi:hypothetical protein